MVDRLTGRVAPIALLEFDPFYSTTTWYRDYVAYCGVSESGKKTYALVIQLGRRRPILKKTIALARVDVAHGDIGTMVEIGKLDGPQKRLPARIVLQLSCTDRSGLARLQRGLRLEHRRVDVGVHLTVTAFLMHKSTVSVDDVNRRGATALGGPGPARPRNLLCGFARNLVAVEDTRRRTS